MYRFRIISIKIVVLRVEEFLQQKWTEYCKSTIIKKYKKKKKKKEWRNSRCGSVVMNPTSIHDAAGTIPGLTQWVKYLALP